MTKTKGLLLLVVLVIVVNVIFFFAADGKKTKQETSNTDTSQAQTTAAVDVPHQGYQRHQAGYGLSLELPEAWVVLSAEQTKELEKVSESVTGIARDDKAISLSANANKDGKLNTATVRVVFTDKSFGKDDLLHLTRSNIDDVCEVISSSLTPSLEKINSTLTSAVTCSLSTVNNTPAFLAEFHRKGILDNDDWEVKSYQLPLAEKMAVLTVTYNVTSQTSKNEIDTVLHSVKFN
ncbi:hypothetical protein DFO53_3568 [Enterobacter sp. AG5470]|nr:hypothetical protein DFO53_3568 [Enterobacter sp. AG5470]